ncbi:MAG TPA: LytTR family DNA-binding domain-containing protein, partial [Flavihumibacter sp.]|nr:LytTR family DNA-binding domain-containing protein [Flavihumibacter sp.]
MIRCIAIDDEPLALELLEDNISKIPFLQLVASCGSAFEAMKVLETEKIDLVFLDIQMPGLTGLQFLQSLQQKPMAILITAYEKYALQGFVLDVVDYLVKPVALDRFVKACNKARELFDLRRQAGKPDAPVPEYIFVHADYSQVKLVFSDIAWIESMKDYLKLHLQSTSKPLILRMSMKDMEEQLPATQFVRIHRSYIVSKKHITA